jgi:hypothetical protein
MAWASARPAARSTAAVWAKTSPWNTPRPDSAWITASMDRFARSGPVDPYPERDA